jgi:peptidyl-prolyl cis-trans isomerase D
MRDWFVKWEKVIVLTIVILFTAGIVWWSVAAYLGNSKLQQQLINLQKTMQLQ